MVKTSQIDEIHAPIHQRSSTMRDSYQDLTKLSKDKESKSREEQFVKNKGSSVIVKADFSSETMETRRQ